MPGKPQSDQSQLIDELNADVDLHYRNDPRLQPYLTWTDAELIEYGQIEGEDVPRYILLLGAYARDNGMTDVVE